MSINRKKNRSSTNGLSRRQFLQAGALGATGLLASSLVSSGRALAQDRRPNILFINADQLGIEAIGAHGCNHVHTPNMDRIARRGVTFLESHSANPVCCPARACWMTGRWSSENGVFTNRMPIVEDMPDLGQWLSARGYETVHAGKWHIPRRDVTKSFHRVFGSTGFGEYSDEAVARMVEGYLFNRTGSAPFFLVVGLLQPHDICFWVMNHSAAPQDNPYPEIADKLPPLPPNFHYDPNEPEYIKMRLHDPNRPVMKWSEDQWRYYLWAYHRHVEMVDAVIGHILDALEDSGHADNTVVIFSADHGEGQARHQTVTKGFLYNEALKVPMMVSCPGRVLENVQDTQHLVSGVDLMPTVCDYAGVETPPDMRGRSLRPLVEGKPTEWREFVPAEAPGIVGQVIRTPDYKYIAYEGDTVDQLFDMKNDPWETKNLAGEASHAKVVQEHRKLLAQWKATLKRAPEPPGGWRVPQRKLKK